MTITERILKRYTEGRITATGVMLEVLSLTDKAAVEEALRVLPSDVMRALRQFVSRYSVCTKVFSGPRPNMQMVRYVRGRIAKPTRVKRPTSPIRRRELP